MYVYIYSKYSRAVAFAKEKMFLREGKVSLLREKKVTVVSWLSGEGSYSTVALSLSSSGVKKKFLFLEKGGGSFAKKRRKKEEKKKRSLKHFVSLPYLKFLVFFLLQLGVPHLSVHLVHLLCR